MQNLGLLFSELPEGSFSEMEELEVLNLEHTGLRTLVLADSLHLKLLQIEGNPLHCDCHARWLWGFAKSNPQNVMLPKCATPYSAREIPLANLAGIKRYFISQFAQVMGYVVTNVSTL